MEEWDETKNTWYETIQTAESTTELGFMFPYHFILTCLCCHVNKSPISIILEQEVRSIFIVTEHIRPRLAQDWSNDHTATTWPTSQQWSFQLFLTTSKKKIKKKNPMFQVNTVTSHLCTCWLRPQQLRQTARWCPCSHHWQPRPFLRERGGQHFHWRSSPRRLSNGLFPAQKHR